MKLAYRHSRTGQRVTKRFTRWPDLLDEAWRIAMMLKTIPAPEGERAEQMELTK